MNPRNWRPITLVNVDYKICARAFEAHLLKVLHHFRLDQTGGLPGCFIGENVALVRASPFIQGITRPGLTTPLLVLSLCVDDASVIASSAMEEAFCTYAYVLRRGPGKY